MAPVEPFDRCGAQFQQPNVALEHGLSRINAIGQEGEAEIAASAG
jgi:hypothetical protein